MTTARKTALLTIWCDAINKHYNVRKSSTADNNEKASLSA
jgi:hypothetical protein